MKKFSFDHIFKRSAQQVLNKAISVSQQQHGLWTNNKLIISQQNRTLLHHAASEGNLQLLEQLVSKQINIDCVTSIDYLFKKNNRFSKRLRISCLTPLHISILNNQYSAAKILLVAGARPTLELTIKGAYKSSMTPLQLAVLLGKKKLMKLLLAQRIDIDQQSVNGFTALHIAILGENIRVANLLLKYGASPNIPIKKGQYKKMSALHLSCLLDVPQLVEAIACQPQCSISATSVDRVTPLHIASLITKYPEVIYSLLSNGARLDLQTRMLKTTPIHHAALNPNWQILATILAFKPQVSTVLMRNRSYFTAAEYAAKKCHYGHTELLEGYEDMRRRECYMPRYSWRKAKV